MTPRILWIIPVSTFGLLFAASVGAQTRDFNDNDSYRCRVSFLDPDVSVRACTAIIQSPAETTEARNNMLYYRGSAYLRRGDYDLAIGDFDQAIKLNPLDVAAWSSRAYAYDAKGDYDRAIQNFDEAIRLGKNSANDWNLRGNSYRHKGDYDRAIQDYDRALELVSMRVDNVGPQFHARFLNNRALAKLAKGDVAGADADFAEAKQIDPQTRCSTSPRNVLVENCLSAGVGR